MQITSLLRIQRKEKRIVYKKEKKTRDTEERKGIKEGKEITKKENVGMKERKINVGMES